MSLISGVKEKVIAAKEVGIAEVILPIGNERDYDGMQSYLKESLEAHFVSGHQDVAKILCIER
jgi:ATP-dependent Lon protease